MDALTRRSALKVIGLGTTLTGLTPAVSSANPVASFGPFIDRWANMQDGVWLGESFWANPMEDWRIVNGAAECQTGGGDRNIHLLTHEFAHTSGSFATSVSITRTQTRKIEGGAGFKLGIHSEIREYRSNCFAKNGINAGLLDGQLILAGKRQAFPALKTDDPIRLSLTGSPTKAGDYQLELTAATTDGTVLATLTQSIDAEKLLGNIALVNNYDPSLKNPQGASYRFENWQVSGDAFKVDESRKFGPILWSMYTLSDSRGESGFELKLTALIGPVGTACQPTVELLSETPAGWKSHGVVSPDTDAWTTTFSVPNWDASRNVAYKLIYRETGRDGASFTAERTGQIKANPTGRPLRIGALTCQNDYAFPYAPVADNVLALDPDMVYFSGDQLYENHGGYGLIRDPAEPAILNYLRKFYQFGWAFGELMRSRPTVCIPDDHDVFQGNIWGEGGKAMEGNDTSSRGGYREPARMVNVVHRTCASHHPAPYDPTPSLQDISVYYGELVYGGVGFAILGDRQWKSGPEHVDTGPGRADHVVDPNFDLSGIDKPGLELLGERQENFLRAWVKDWRGHTMKVLLSQTVFSGLATHHGGYDGFLKADLDSGAWPQTARNRAVDILREGMPLHINGDQHLTTLSQYGVERQRDSCWSFCTPAIAVGYPRWWRPDEVGISHANRPAHGLPDTGEFLDSFGNFTYVYAVGNPEVGTAPNRYDKAHQKGSGFGFVTIDLDRKTYFIEAYRFLVDPTDGNPNNQFPGFPVTIHQQENRGENRLS